jgi:hypothetical protein
MTFQALASSSLEGRNLLQEYTTVLLDQNASYGDLHTASWGLYTLFGTITNLLEQFGDTRHHRDTFTDTGKALSLRNAARCLWDFMRTSRFLQGVHAGILAAQQRYPDQRIEVLYAGSGPFAPLAIPLMLCFSPEQVRFTIMDIHQEAIDAVQQILLALNLDMAGTNLVVADATTYVPPADQRFHVLVSETMKKALDEEPQVAITHHLATFLHPEGVLIPERIVVKACLADTSREMTFIDPDGSSSLTRVRQDLGVIGEASLATLRSIPGAVDTPSLMKPVTITIPEDRPATATTFFLLTHITTFGTIHLDDYDSGLSYPTVLEPLSNLPPGTSVQFQYILGNHPQFTFHILDAETPCGGSKPLVSADTPS